MPRLNPYEDDDGEPEEEIVKKVSRAFDFSEFEKYLRSGTVFVPGGTYRSASAQTNARQNSYHYNTPNLWADFVPPRPKALPKEKSTELVVGYRGWKFCRTYPIGVRLASVTTRFAFAPFTRAEAQCVNSDYARDHAAPSLNCGCGIYAYRDGVEIDDKYEPKVVGEVYLWGRILVCEKGYRAQYAYPKRLAVVDGTQKQADDISFTYGVPCEVF